MGFTASLLFKELRFWKQLDASFDGFFCYVDCTLTINYCWLWVDGHLTRHLRMEFIRAYGARPTEDGNATEPSIFGLSGRMPDQS